jgi:hypothetical protein
MAETVKVDIEMSCSECSGSLNVKQDKWGTVLIDPCAKCLDGAKDKAEGEGYARGLKDGAE